MFLLIVVAQTSLAQNKNALISFKKIVNDFGTIKEDDGIVTCDFEFINSGKSPLIVQRVITSCDCATTEWTKEPVLPGASGVVKIAYNPKDRPGKFSKMITVYSNAETSTNVLQISGLVLEHQKTQEEIYIRPIGDLRFKNTHLSFDRIFVDTKKTDTLEYVNMATGPVKVSCNVSGQPFLTVKVTPETVKPNEKGLIIVTYDAKKRNDWGFVVDRFSLIVNDKAINDALISISASIEENFSTLSEEQRANAPKMEMASTDYSFGQIEEGQLIEKEFTFKNVGKGDLIIRKIKASCGCTTVEPADRVIKAGQTSSFKASVRTTGFSGRIAKSITVITNDPITPNILVRMTGIVNPLKK